MSRRSRKKKNSPALAIFGGIALVAAIAAGYLSLPKGDTTQAKSFPLSNYVEDCNSLRGSVYSLSGEILENFHHDPEVGKFIFLNVDTDDESDAPKSVGLLVPSDIDGPNLETKQSYTFVVSVKREGMLVAQEYSSN